MLHGQKCSGLATRSTHTPQYCKKVCISAAKTLLFNKYLYKLLGFQMLNKYDLENMPARLRGANAMMLDHYAQFASHVLTLTLSNYSDGSMPSADVLDKQIGHIKATLNWHIWGKRTRKNAKAKILFIPVLEGTHTCSRAHFHIVLGNVIDEAHIHAFLSKYIPKSKCLARRYKLDSIYASDGLSLYLAKETSGINLDAIRWQSSLIPNALIPKRSTMLKA
jgi:hypothetical protein